MDQVRVHLDHAATTPLRPEVADVMGEVSACGLGNPSSRHTAGRQARRRLDDARDELASHLGARPSEIVFTSGGTEADDLAIAGVTERRGGTAVCSAIEHDAVLEPVLHRGGSLIAVDSRGQLDLDDLEHTLVDHAAKDGVAVVSVMTVNNENGVRQDLAEVAEVVRRVAPQVPLHTDAVQAAPWMDLSGVFQAVHLMSLSAHKFGGPVGIGALVVRDGTPLAPRLRGGGQENERRSGTVNVVGAVAMARAFSLAAAERDVVAPRVAALRDRFADAIRAAVPDVVEPACPDPKTRNELVGGTVQVCFPGIESEALLFLADEAGLDASAGSACAAGALEPSHVLSAMGVAPEIARGALRVSVGRDTTTADIDFAVRVVIDAVTRLRGSKAA